MAINNSVHFNMINSWAKKWGVSAEALDDLREQLTPQVKHEDHVGLSETSLLSKIRIEASKKGLRLWRNNCGAVTDINGNFFRYGLANDSAAVNKTTKSSDLIGIRPIKLSNGAIIGQFVAREIKKSGWKYVGTEREKAQLNFLTLIASFGGDAAFANSEGTL